MPIKIDLIPREQIVRLADSLALDPDLSLLYEPAELREINRRAEVERLRLNGVAIKLHDLDGGLAGATTATVLKVRDLAYPLDDIARAARQATGEHYLEELQGKPAAERIPALITTATVANVTKRLNARGLEDVERALLALPAVYEALLIAAVQDENVDDDDEEGLFDAVIRGLAAAPRQYFLNEIAGRVLDRENITLDDDELTALRDLVFERGVSLRAGAVRRDVLDLVSDGQDIGALRYYVERYAALGEIDAELFTKNVKREMARFLFARGIHVSDRAAFDRGKYDEHFALAYYHASRVAEGSDDPIDVARTKGGVSDWDFTIRRISETDRPIVRAELIRAAGALYAIFVEGEQIHIFDIADALLTEWHRGTLDIPDGEAAAMLNRYEILMRDRPTEEERHMHYRRVFNIGDSEMLSGTVANDAFPGLWDNMMYEAAHFLDKTERYFTEEKIISRAALYQAIQDLQYNLSEYMTGSTPKKTTEMYRHLEEALDIIGSEDVLNHVGGRRKSIKTVIERVGREALGVAIPTNTLFTLAERGNDIFHFIADFAPENVANDEFQRFLDACKACIVSQASLEPHEEERYAEPEYENGNGNGNGNGHGLTRWNRYPKGNGHKAPAGRKRSPQPAGAYNNGGAFDDWDS